MILKAIELIGKRRFAIKPSKLEINHKSTSSFEMNIVHRFYDTLIIVDRASKYTDSVMYLEYFTRKTPNQKYATYVPNDFTFEAASLEEKKEILKTYDKYLLDNLKDSIHHYFTIGADPEVFVEDRKGNLMPAFTFLPSKDKPAINAGHNTIFWDGFQAEFTTQAGVTCLDSHISSIQYGLLSVLELARKKDPFATLSYKTVINLSPEQLRDTADEHIQFGCMPSLNIYDLKGSTEHGRDVPYRPAGGHIHFGIGNKKTQEEIVQIVKALDAIVGVACVSLFANFDDPKRRQLYGLPGEYRLPTHGLEYRTLSNAWLMHPTIAYMVHSLARNAVMFAEKGLLKHWKGSSAESREVILKCDVKQARVILERNKDTLIKMMRASYRSFDDVKAEAVYKAFLNGAESIIETPQDLIKNWDLDNKKGWNYGLKQVVYNINTLLVGKKVA